MTNQPQVHVTHPHMDNCTMLKTLMLMIVVTSCVAKTDPRPRKLETSNSKVNCTGNVCDTEECVSTAARILESLDLTTDPCQDFYQFACGGWVDDQILPPHRMMLRTLHDQDKHLASAKRVLSEEPHSEDLTSVRKARDMYASCLNYATRSEADTAVVDVVRNTFGEWPLAVEDWDEDDFDLEDFLMKAAFLGVNPLFKLDVYLTGYLHNGKPMLSHLLWLKEPELGLPVQQYTENSLAFQIYRTKILEDAKRFGIANKKIAEKEAKDIASVEYNLIKFIKDRKEASETNFTIAELQENFGELMNWSSFITSIASSETIGITDITDQEVLSTQYPLYLANMTEYFSQLPARTQANYIIWKVISSLDNVLMKENKKIDTLLNRVVYGTTAETSPEEACVIYVSKAFSLVLHRLLYTEKFPPEEIDTVYSMFKRIQDEFDVVLAEHDWVDEPTAKFIQEKNAALSTTLLFYETSMNDQVLENFYENVTVDEEDFIDNVVNERKEAFARNLRRLRKPYEMTTDTMPHEMVAQNNFLSNRMEFTSTIFEPPMYINHVPVSINYGGMGAIFGHEIIHAFDSSGFSFNKEGAQGEWWSNETLTKFKERHQCMIEQFNNFYYEPAEQNVDGMLTLGENIADSGGVKLAYRAYKKDAAETGRQGLSLPGIDFSQDQLFFVNFAQMWCEVGDKQAAEMIIKDEHSPQRFRVLGTVQNSKDFARVFHCPRGSEMNPDTKCEVW